MPKYRKVYPMPYPSEIEMHEMEGGKKNKRVYKKKKGGEEMQVMEGGKKKRVYKKKGGAVSQVAGQLKKLSDAITQIMNKIN